MSDIPGDRRGHPPVEDLARNFTCPACGHHRTRVVRSSPDRIGASIKRRRECDQCQARFTTWEHISRH